MEQPKVSVFIKKDIKSCCTQQAIDCLTHQTYDNLEIFIGTPDLTKATGEYIFITNTNNIYEPDLIENLVSIALENHADMVSFNLKTDWESNSDSRYIKGASFAFPFNPYTINGSIRINEDFFLNFNSLLESTFFKKDFLNRHNLLNEKELKYLPRLSVIHIPNIYTTTKFLGTHIIPMFGDYRTVRDRTNDLLIELGYLKKYLKKNKIKTWAQITEFYYNFLNMDSPELGFLTKLISHNYIQQCSIHLVDHCNLNCKSCSHFSCLARPGDYILDPKDFEIQMYRLSKLTKRKIKILELYGGEPLLHPNVPAIMKIARRYFPKSYIRIITNGLLLNHQTEDFWKTAHKNKIVIAPTKYPIKIDWESIEKTAFKHKVEINYFGGTNFYQKTLYHKPMDLTGSQNPSYSYINCRHTSCITLYQGKLYHCPICAYIKYFNREFKQKLKVLPVDYIDIFDKNITSEDIFTFCYRPVPFCRYCISNATTYGHPWEQTKKDIKEWTL